MLDHVFVEIGYIVCALVNTRFIVGYGSYRFSWKSKINFFFKKNTVAVSIFEKKKKFLQCNGGRKNTVAIL